MEDPNAFKLFITHVDGEGPFLRISGQVDKQALGVVESLFAKCRNDLENGVNAVQPSAMVEGLVCAVKYKDGVFYRVKIISTNDIERGIVGVLFIDYGNKDLVSVHAARLLENQEALLMKLPPLAENFYLWHIVNPGRWDESALLKLQNLLCYAEYPAIIKGSLHNVHFIQIQFRGQDLSTYLQNSLSLYGPVADSPVVPMSIDEDPVDNWPPYNHPGEIACAEVVPFLNNQNFPLNPASAMRVNQNMNFQVGDLAIKAPRAVSLRPLSRQPFGASGSYPPSPKSVQSGSAIGSPTSSMSSVTSSPIYRVKTIKSRLLPTNGVYKVFVPYADEGPELFAVQLVTETDHLYAMMEEINSRPHQSLKEPPMIGSVCLGRMTLDRLVCRAIVMNICGSQCKLYFIDFGDTEMISYYDIFDIPEEFVKPNVFAMRFCLSGLKKIRKTQHTIETFKKLVEDKVVTLRVMPPEGPPLIQYGELYVDNVNVLEYLMADYSPRYTKMKLIHVGQSTLALVSYVDSCAKFYIHLSSLISNLNFVMDAMKKHCETSVPLQQVSVGTACCALFPDDGKWYRALVLRIDGTRITVFYVDYGNEQEVELSDLRSITLDFMQLPALAMRCALKEFENKGDDQLLSNQLEMLVLEKTFTVHVKGMLTEDTMLVTLTDDRVSPPINIGQVMSQLSKPKSQEPKMQSPKHEPEGDRRRPPKAEEYRQPPPFLKPPTYRRKTRPAEPAAESASSMDYQNAASSSSSPPVNEQQHANRSVENGSQTEIKVKINNTSSVDGSNNNMRGYTRNVHHLDPENYTKTVRCEFGRIKVRVTNFTPQTDEDQSGESSSHNRDVQRTEPENNSRRDQRNRDFASGRDYSSRDNASGRDYNSRANTSGRDHSSRDRPSGRDYNSRANTSGRDYNTSGRDYSSRDNTSGRDYNTSGRDYNTSGRDYSSRDNTSGRDYNNRDNTSGRDYNNRDNTSGRDYNSRDNTSGRDYNSRELSRREQNPRRDIRDRPPKNQNNSFESDSSNNQKSKPRGKFTQVQSKQLRNPQPLNKAFEQPTIDPTSQLEVAVTWLVSPENFYNQILTFQPKFLEMMHKIPEVYRGIRPYNGPISEGDSVLARFPEDGVLYRATVVSIRPFGKFLVQYVDFGNKFLVESKDIWQLDGWLMKLPKLAVNCSLVGVTSKDGPWKATKDLDRCFNAPRYQCVFLDNIDGVYQVSMYNNGVSVADTLIQKGLAEASAASNVAEAVELKDEPVDWALITNNKFISKVTHVESASKFFIQMDDEKMTLIEELLAKATLVPVAADVLVDKMPCAVKIEGKVYRANYVGNADQSTVTLHLYDYGYCADVKEHEVMLSPPEVACFYPQAVECGFNKEKTPLKTFDQVKDMLLGKHCIVHVDSVDGNRLLTTLYSLENGGKIEIFEPESCVAEAVSPLCARAVFNHNFGLAVISHCQSLTEIYLHKSTDVDGIALMLDDLYQYYEEGTEAELLSEYEKGGLCAAKSSDGNWYRATVASYEDETVEVQFPDYGNFEVINKGSVKKLAKQFHKPCARALLVSLGLDSINDSALATLQEWIGDKEVQVTLSRQKHPGCWLANLHLDGDDLALKLINASLAAPIPESEEAPEASTSVYVSHVDSPGQFWLQMPSLVDTIEEVQSELQANAATYPELEKRELGTICAAQYSADEQWYRAEILDADADITTVRFIDYGNADVLNNTPSSLKQLPEHLAAMPASSVKASVNAVPTGTGEWSEAATELFTQLLGERIDPFRANIVLTGLTTYIDVFVEGKNVTDALVAEGHATKSDCSGDLPSCYASHVNSPAEFWIQLAYSTQEFQIMEAELAKADTYPELDVKLDGVICAAKFNDDNCYYRAQIIVDGSEGTEVLFMDYGNASISNDLRLIPADLVSKPALARKCALQKPRDIKTWSRRAEEKFNEIAAEGATIFKVQFIASGDISVVELYLEGKSITETLVSLCEEETVIPKAAPVQVDKVFTAKTYFVLAEEREDKLTSVQEQLKNAADYKNLSNLEVGTVCAALSVTDEVWYRAKILQSTDAETLVEFIDYGNKEACSQLKQLPENLSAMEPLAKRCSLLYPEVGPESLVDEVKGEELNDSNASIVTVVSIPATVDTGYTSSADMEKSPVTDVVTDDDSLSPRKQNDAESDDTPQIDDNDITTTTEFVETPQESGDNDVSVDVSFQSASSKLEIDDVKTEQLSSEVIEKNKGDIECHSAETENSLVTEEVKPQEAFNISELKTELDPKDTKLSDIQETDKLSTMKEEKTVASNEIPTVCSATNAAVETDVVQNDTGEEIITDMVIGSKAN